MRPTGNVRYQKANWTICESESSTPSTIVTFMSPSNGDAQENAMTQLSKKSPPSEHGNASENVVLDVRGGGDAGGDGWCGSAVAAVVAPDPGVQRNTTAHTIEQAKPSEERERDTHTHTSRQRVAPCTLETDTMLGVSGLLRGAVESTSAFSCATKLAASPSICRGMCTSSPSLSTSTQLAPGGNAPSNMSLCKSTLRCTTRSPVAAAAVAMLTTRTRGGGWTTTPKNKETVGSLIHLKRKKTKQTRTSNGRESLSSGPSPSSVTSSRKLLQNTQCQSLIAPESVFILDTQTTHDDAMATKL